MAEKNQDHRQLLEKAALQNEIDSGRRGQIFGIIVALAAIGAGAYTASLGHVVIGTSLSGGVIGVIVTAYFGGLYSRRKEREQRAKIMTGANED